MSYISVCNWDAQLQVLMRNVLLAVVEARPAHERPANGGERAVAAEDEVAADLNILVATASGS